MINLNLGRFYEREGRTKRAFSRYVQAVIQPESGPQALEALARVQPQLEGEDVFSVDLIERLIAGKVENFGAATRYTPDDGGAAGVGSGRVVLAEFFTNAHLEAAIGGALGREGMLSHFGPEYLAAVEYHVEAPQLDPLTNAVAADAARRYGLESVAHVVDGLVPVPPAGRSRFKERIYNACRDAVIAELARPTRYLLEAYADVRGTVVTGTVSARGEARPDTLLQVLLVERAVLFPGKSKVVIHRMVARASLTEPLGGVPWEPEEGEQEVAFECDLADVQAANERYLDEREAAGAGLTPRVSMRIDPRQVAIIGVLRDAKTNEVLQAVRVDAACEAGTD
jgi:hypothetical protein